MEKEMEKELKKTMEIIIKMWKVVVFPDDEVSAVPCSWLIEIDGKIMCFWPEKNARTKRVKDENPPSSGNDKYKLYDCRVIFNGEAFKTFKEALAMEIKAQEVSYIEASGDGTLSEDGKDEENEKDEFEFIKPKPEINIINEVIINEPSTALVTSESEKDLNSIQSSSIVLNKEVFREVVPAVNTIVLLENNQSNALEKDTTNLVSEKNIVIEVPFVATCPDIDMNILDEVQAFESRSTSEKLKTIILNQIAEKKVYTELSNRLAGIEKHIKKYGGVGAYSKAIEELPLQVSSVPMFSKLEDTLDVATKTALAEYFNKTIYEQEIKQFVKILLLRFFDGKFYAHHVTGKSGGEVVLIKSQILSCIYDCIEKKFGKKQRDVADTVFRAIDQLKDSLRKKFPKLPADRKRKLQKEESESVEDKDKKKEADKKTKRDRIRERLQTEERESGEKNEAEQEQSI